ncbi:formate dehydrogenase subunit gamma [Bordetella hinzii]|uniref:Formate dehydrogenase subunit gamma n=2 Tax=Bordetella hinzii TaxID=103855 RepID=A0AAN1RVV9_9BORD|nr:formate dehydrogenase subunit gamma [Bordetella hinzii]AKQ62102.1 Formate dehydrogenase, cytochrome b556(fdo) subunit [Bordetella hinzii]AZW16983.1 formate dehydrogenase subunit gamma [Bordetella hinzii]KCB23539.1 formate dehydrogenase, gamma subunit [Bordetella hinzii OH87 BAL007II]KCB31958.1 formate dehydrogenase, gamma subunit [Bordetella hinzii CA90 BAL1384]KCB45664.1 formate dehydrogenase, gamma subunit [Bordetella hinzii 5132]
MADPRRSKQILRYTAGERTNHWLIALTFILLALSGLALFHPAFSWLYALLGGGPWTRILHPFIGVVMFVCFFIFAGHMWRHNLMTKNDRQWLRQLGDVLNNREDKLPEVGKYNAGQKLLFYVLVICMLGLVLTGIVMWRPYFAGYFPIDGIRVASLLHAVFAFVLICAIIVHIYAAIWVKGSVRAMVRGTVSWGWAWKHHRAWFRSVRKESPGGE